jgi:hypothetical protein
MWRFLFIGLLIAHGLVHLAIWLMPKPPDQRAPFEPVTRGCSATRRRWQWSLP